MSQTVAKKPEITLRGYITGFVASLALTLVAYVLVHYRASAVLSHRTPVAIAGIVALLALTQFIVQLNYFLHLGAETKPRWKLLVLIFMILIVLILVGGTLWIMHNLDYRMMPSTNQINNYMNAQSGF